MDTTIYYVVGFLFSEDRTKVALITKNKPEWQKGLLNGVGGKIEQNEKAIDAMVREFQEETGVLLDTKDWRQYLWLSKLNKWHITIYKSFNNKIFDVKTTTSEEIAIYNISDLLTLKTISNIPWLIYMALDENFDGMGNLYYR